MCIRDRQLGISRTTLWRYLGKIEAGEPTDPTWCFWPSTGSFSVLHTEHRKSVFQKRAACIHRMQFKGLGVPQQVFCNAKMVYIYVWRHLLLALWGCSKRLPNLTIILQEWSSVFKLNLKQTVVFLLGKVPSLHSVANRTSYPALSFYQGFHHFFSQSAESSVFSKLFVDTARFLW